MSHPAAPARRALIHLKHTLADCYRQGLTPHLICDGLGKPWTPDLLAACFPDVEAIRNGTVLAQPHPDDHR